MKRMRRVFSAMLGVCAILTFSLAAAAKQPDGYSYEELRANLRQQGLFDTTYLVEMRDKVKLSTTVFKSMLGGPFPAIVVRTPYGKDDDRLDLLQMVILKGYALVIQDVRGRYGSEGENIPFLNDAWGSLQDGYDTIEWIAAQSWCNGKVGSWGPSAMGIVQSLTAGAKPPHLVCQVIGYAASQQYGQAAYQDGVFREDLAVNWLKGIDASANLPLFVQHPFYDDFWAQVDAETKYPEVNVPALFIGGWYDIFLQGTLHDFVGRQTNGAEGARGKQKAFIGPWTHTNEWNVKQGELIYPVNANWSGEVEITLNWFDYWLKGSDNATKNLAAVNYYVMGDVSDTNAPGNVWRSSDVWPIGATNAALYLQPAGSLSTALSSDGTLDLAMNPSQPVPTTGGANLDSPAGPYDQSALEKRGDVLVFSTPPLANAVEVIGEIHATIYAESNLTDNDITVRLCDVYPDGRSMLVLDGVARASMVKPYTQSTPVAAGQVHAYDVDCWSTALVFNKGHRIRMIVANTNYPRFEINPVYKQLGQNGLPSEAITKIHFSQQYPSAIYLPVTDAGALPPPTSVSEWRTY